MAALVGVPGFVVGFIAKHFLLLNMVEHLVTTKELSQVAKKAKPPKLSTC